MIYKHLCLVSLLFTFQVIKAQSIPDKIKEAVIVFEKDRQLENAMFSLYVTDAKTGEVLYDKNGTIGLATASCLKLVTSATAYEVLGATYQFVTQVGYTGAIDNGILQGNLVIVGSGDPTLGSWRWEGTKTNVVINKIAAMLQKKAIKNITGKIIIQDGFNKNVTPSNWIWEDLGNYYGAPARLFNWRENQYDIHFASPAKIGEATKIVNTEPELPNLQINNEVTAAEVGSGDNSVIYLPIFGTEALVKGTIPANETKFMVSGSMPNPTAVFAKALVNKLKGSGIKLNDQVVSTSENGMAKKEWVKLNLIDTISSPTLENINYWFMKKSINLYGETFLNKMALGKQNTGKFDTKSGTSLVKNFWQQKGISANALNIYDGSGLSPANRVTTKTLATILQYAKKQTWFESYLNAFPNYNEMKLKSGTIGDVKGFAGYHTAKDGTDYIVAFLVNNYNGSSKLLVSKMFKVLDVLK
jgi:serine-type D-Ala-D-Ala carboxypeptidase/endopeptidase (penicillin-binding protein 4)